jgi:hypothetical protein
MVAQDWMGWDRYGVLAGAVLGIGALAGYSLSFFPFSHYICYVLLLDRWVGRLAGTRQSLAFFLPSLLPGYCRKHKLEHLAAVRQWLPVLLTVG